MESILVARKEFRVGVPTVIEGPSPSPPLAVVFEDDGETGYLYALDPSYDRGSVVDALQIYSVAAVSDRDLPSRAEIIWSHDHLKAALLINGYMHAIVDFNERRGYCRTAFPPSGSCGWTRHGHEWVEGIETLFDQGHGVNS